MAFADSYQRRSSNKVPAAAPVVAAQPALAVAAPVLAAQPLMAAVALEMALAVPEMAPVVSVQEEAALEVALVVSVLEVVVTAPVVQAFSVPLALLPPLQTQMRQCHTRLRHRRFRPAVL